MSRSNCPPEAMLEWLIVNAGCVIFEDGTNKTATPGKTFIIEGEQWACWGAHNADGPTLVTFQFKDPSIGTLFKLTWGGQ